MKAKNTQESGEGHPRVHDDNPQDAGHPRVHDDNPQDAGHPRVHDDNPQDAGHPRVHDDNPHGEERRSNDGGRSETELRASRVRVIDEKREQGGDGAQQQANEAGTELGSSARARTDSGSVAFGTAAHLILFWQRQLADFFSMRVNKNLQFGGRLFGVRDLNDWVRLNSDYTREMVFDYASSVSNIMERSMKEVQQRSR